MLKQWRYIVVATVVSLTLLVGGTFAYLFSFYTAPSPLQYSRADCIVVFGAAVLPGGKPSDAIRDRVHEAVTIYKQQGPKCLLLSGAPSVFGKHEVDVMFDLAYAQGVTLTDIRLDYNGINTKHTIDNLDPRLSYVFVSSDFHLARINLLARQAGIAHYSVVPSVYQNGRYTRETFLIMREIVAFWYYVLIG